MSYSDLFLHIIPRKEAKRLGLTDYISTRSCKHGHYPRRRTSNGECRECARIYAENRTMTIGDEVRRLARESYARNPEKYLSRKREWRLNNPERAREIKRNSRNIDADREYSRKWKRENRDRATASENRRRAAKMQAVPAWYNHEEFIRLQKEAIQCGKHVDHIIPLQSKYVCGLHCMDNFQLLTPEENGRKSNIYWPDMPNCDDKELKLLVMEFEDGN